MNIFHKRNFEMCIFSFWFCGFILTIIWLTDVFVENSNRLGKKNKRKRKRYTNIWILPYFYIPYKRLRLIILCLGFETKTRGNKVNFSLALHAFVDDNCGKTMKKKQLQNYTRRSENNINQLLTFNSTINLIPMHVDTGCICILYAIIFLFQLLEFLLLFLIARKLKIHVWNLIEKLDKLFCYRIMLYYTQRYNCCLLKVEKMNVNSTMFISFRKPTRIICVSVKPRFYINKTR